MYDVIIVGAGVDVYKRQHQGHAGAVVDENAGGTGHAIAAAAAEFPVQLRFFLLDKGSDLRVQGGRLVHVGKPLFQLGHFLNAPDGKHIVELGHEGKGSPGVIDEASGQPFHGDEAHVMFFTKLNQIKLLLRGEVA